VTWLDHAPSAVALETERLALEPLRAEHADEIAPLLDDAQMYVFTGGEPPTLAQLRASYERRLAADAGGDTERWCNWIVRHRDSGQAVGGLQATITATNDGFAAELAWIVASAYQGRGYAREAATAMAGWLRQQGAQMLVADIHPEHHASMAVARALGLTVSDEVIDGEIRWIG
jgi:RimJ/RimL family protein N-acetyltransferase